MTPEALAAWWPALVGALAAALLLALGWALGRRSRPRGLRRVEQALAEVLEGRAPEAEVTPGDPAERALNQIGALAHELADRRGPRERRLSRFGAATEALSGSGLVLLDRDLVVAAVGEPFAVAVGERAVELEGRKAELLFTPGSWREVAVALLDARRRREPLTVRGDLRRATGPPRTAQIHVGFVDDPIDGIALWIVPQANGEEAGESPMQALARTRAVLDAVADGVLVVAEGTVGEANPTARAWFGADPAGHLLRDLFDAESLLLVLDRVARAGAGESAGPVRARIRPLAGRVRAREVELEAAGAGPGLPGAAVLTLRDAAPEQVARRRARTHEARLRSVLDAIAEGVALLAPGGAEHPEWRVALLNRRVAALLGVEPAAVLGASEAELIALLAHRFRDASAFVAFLERAAAEPGADHVAAFDTRGAEAQSLEVVARPVTGEDGELLGRLLVVRDVTRHLAAERRLEADAVAMTRSREALQRAYEELSSVHRDLERKTAELNRAHRELVELDAARAQLLDDVTHELQAPLVSIRGYTQMVLDGRLGRVNDEQRRGLEVALRNVERMVEMISNLLGLARADRAAPLAAEPVELAAALQDALERAGPAAVRRGVRLEMRPVPAGLAVLAEREAFARVVDNLVGNAIKFNRSGGSVSVAARPGPGDVVTLEVADTGVGIAPDEKERIFERFYRGRGATATPGTGIGLALVRSVVLRHGGRIEVESAPGQGSVFRVSWPRRLAEANSA
ncbi:MAG: PAS domain-containing sensor histidine kinase [Acidobacteria bacterium]|nr:PAS domain-containing sensor histidine kinase [Acidobacteriota bacterium]